MLKIEKKTINEEDNENEGKKKNICIDQENGVDLQRPQKMKDINNGEAPLKVVSKRQSNIIYSISIKELLLAQETSVSIVRVRLFIFFINYFYVRES